MPKVTGAERTASYLKLLISEAERLGFWDDMIEYEKELAEMLYN